MPQPDQSMRFLGFAFASADLLFELNPQGVITLALGAAKKVTGIGNVTLANTSWRVLFEPCDHGVFSAFIAGVSGAERKGPVRVQLKSVAGQPPRFAQVFACRLPQLAPNISCTLSLSASAPGEASATPGLMDRGAFDQAVGRLLADAKDSGIDVELALVEMAGLGKAIKKLGQVDGAAAQDDITDVLRAESIQGAAVRLQDERFALLRERPEGEDTFTKRLQQAASDAGVAIEPQAAILALGGVATSQSLRALRFTLDHFLKEGMNADGDMAALFRQGLDDTLRQAKAFSDTVRARQFKLVYQPIVDLTSREVHHYEALARFPEGKGPFETIRMAEELDIIEAFDLAVAETAIQTLRGHGPEVRIAVNVSGRSFLRPKFLDRLLTLAAGDIRLKTRLLFEITESSALLNLDLAEERIQRLRREGYPVCIDDFGAGAASLSYLRHLSVDIIKIDGQFVRQIEKGGRDGAVVRHLTALCRELGVRTIAEMIENENAVSLLRTVGVDMGQGFLFGAPLAQIPSAAPVRAARRRGEVDSWG